MPVYTVTDQCAVTLETLFCLISLFRPTINLTNLEEEQKKYFESEVLKKIIVGSPMYFV
jgi:hypothetical protein